MNNVKLGGSNVKVINAEMLDRDTVQFELMTVGRARWKIESEIKSGVTIFTLKILTTKASSHLIVPERERRMTEDKLVGISRYEKKLEAASVKHRQIVIVVDAGHGGKDPGAVGRSGLQEKEVTLKISKKLAEKINQTPRMRAVLTRQGDHYLTLRQRLQIARTSNADLFMSIHADAYVNKEAAGASIYALSTRGATSEAARWLADRENYSELGNIKLDDLDDSNKLLRSVLIDMSQTVTIRDSLRLGNKVLDALDRVSDLHRNKVEQAPFVVLKSPDIPSILVETGFITNPYEEQRLQQTDYQEKLASALFDGLKSYFTSQYYLHTASLKQVQLVV